MIKSQINLSIIHELPSESAIEYHTTLLMTLHGYQLFFKLKCMFLFKENILDAVTFTV